MRQINGQSFKASPRERISVETEGPVAFSMLEGSQWENIEGQPQAFKMPSQGRVTLFAQSASDDFAEITFSGEDGIGFKFPVSPRVWQRFEFETDYAGPR